MKKIVRNSVFETNSSSTHSLTVAKDNQEFVIDPIYPDQNGIVRVEGQEFGWGWEKHNDSLTKLAYAFQDGGNFDLIKEVVQEQTGATEVIFVEGGYIDHDGYGTTEEIRGSKEGLKNFIFNRNSWLFIGNDNGSPDPTFYHVPEYKDGKLFQPEFKYELVIEGLDKTTKFMDVPDEEELQDGIDAILDNAYLTEDGQFFNEQGIFWQIQRPRNKYYTKEYSLHQDYSKNEILFMRENDSRWRELEDASRKQWEKDRDAGKKVVNYFERYKELTEEARKLPGLIMSVKFNIKEIK